MLEWDLTSGYADSFYVWAADDFQNLDRRVIGRFAAQLAELTQAETVTLPPEFDRYIDIGQTPFADGTEVTLWVQCWSSGFSGAYSDPAVLSDNVGPSDFILNSNHWQSADNSDGTEAVMPYILLGDSANPIEYVENTPPIVWFTEGGGDPDWKPSSIDVVFNGWDGSLTYSDSLFFTIPAGEDGSGDWMHVTILDNSGNAGTDSIRLIQ